MRSNLAPTSIRFRAAVLTSALAAIAVIAVIAYSFVAMRTILLRSGEARASAAAVQIAGIVGAPLPGRLADVQRMVDDNTVIEAILEPSDDAAKSAMERLKPLAANAQQQQTIELWTAAGVRTMAVRLPQDTGTLPFSTGPPKATGVLPYTVQDGIVISEFVVPVRASGDGSRTIGYLLNRRLATNANPNDALNRLIGSGGRVLVGNQSGTVWIDLAKRVEGLPIDAATAGVYRYTTASGEQRVAGVALVAATPLSIVVDFPQALMIAPAWVLLRQLAVVGLFFVAIALAVVWKLSGRVTRPIDSLVDAVNAVRGGDYSRRVATGPSEVGRLGVAFNAMAEKIQIGLNEVAERERAIRANDQRKSSMMNAALDCIITTDATGRITDCNPAAETTFGYDHTGLLQQNLHELLALPDFDGQLGRRIEVQGVRRSGAHFPADVSLASIPNEGAPGYAAFVRDLTEQKAGEESLLRGIILEEENRRVHEASRLKSEFLANMSHELRTPLNAIIGFAELLYDGQVTPDMPQFKEFMHDILTSGQHLLQLINDVLDLSKVEAGRLEFHPEDTDLTKVVHDSIGILRTLAAQKRLTVHSDVDASIGTVLIDRGRLKQVLYNYLSNAIKFTPEAGRIDVRVTAAGDDHFRVAVRDTGIGISAADVNRLFIEFNQLEAGAAKKHQGTGLGLALTKRLIEAQGGSVGVDSTPGQGSTFFAVLPRRASSGTRLMGPRSITTNQAGAPSVLVIEDDAADQDAIVRSLSSAGFNVETATTRAQALVKLESQSFDALTLDLILPDANGVDVLRDLRASERNRDVPVVVITIVANSGAVAGFAVNDILAKPVDGDGLIKALARAGVSPAADGSILVVDDDPGSLRLMAATLAQLGYRSTCVPRAFDGLRVSEKHAPLAVVLDLQMPEMDGFTFLDHFRRIASCRATPVIVWTVKDLTQQDYDRLRSSVQGIVGKGQSSTASVVDELRRFVGQRQAS